MSRQLSHDLKKRAKQIDCTPFSILLIAYFLCLHKFCNKEDIVVGTPALGRMTKEEETIVGNFISLVTIRSDLSLLKPFSKNNYIKQIHKNIFMAMKHQDYQYDELVRCQV